MATQHLDLDEQEQIANIKYFWQKYGVWITTLVTIVAVAYVGWTGWQWYQSTQAQKAAVLFDELNKSVAAGDLAKTDRVFADMKEKFAGTAYTAQAALLDARMNYEKGHVEPAKAALAWLANGTAEAAYKDLAKLRLGGVLIEAKSYDEAIKVLTNGVSPAFAALAADRLGDAYMLQNKPAEATVQYKLAYAGLETSGEYRKMVEVKLARLGVEATPSK